MKEKNKEKFIEASMKDKIKEQAFLLMAKKGLKDISMREIADACGVTKPVLYYYFKDKEDLCFSLIEEQSIVNNEKLKKVIDSGATLEEILVFIFSKYVSDMKRKDALSFIVHISSYILSNPGLEKKICKSKDKNVTTLKEVLEREYKKGAISKKDKEIGLHLILANIAHVILHSHEQEVKFWPTYAHDMARAVLTAMNYREK